MGSRDGTGRDADLPIRPGTACKGLKTQASQIPKRCGTSWEAVGIVFSTDSCGRSRRSRTPVYARRNGNGNLLGAAPIHTSPPYRTNRPPHALKILFCFCPPQRLRDSLPWSHDRFWHPGWGRNKHRGSSGPEPRETGCFKRTHEMGTIYSVQCEPTHAVFRGSLYWQRRRRPTASGASAARNYLRRQPVADRPTPAANHLRRPIRD